MADDITLDLTSAPVPYLEPISGPITGRVILYGYSLKETTGASPAELDLVDGMAAGSGRLIPITLSAGQSTEDWFGPQGILFRGGILPVITGAITGVLFVYLYD